MTITNHCVARFMARGEVEEKEKAKWMINNMLDHARLAKFRTYDKKIKLLAFCEEKYYLYEPWVFVVKENRALTCYCDEEEAFR